jgi:hypothetical protein
LSPVIDNGFRCEWYNFKFQITEVPILKSNNINTKNQNPDFLLYNIKLRIIKKKRKKEQWKVYRVQIKGETEMKLKTNKLIIRQHDESSLFQMHSKLMSRESEELMTKLINTIRITIFYGIQYSMKMVTIGENIIDFFAD